MVDTAFSGDDVKNNLYAAAWTIIQKCCEAAVTAELLGEPLIAHLANAAALRAAERIGIPERELRRIRQLMMDEMRIGKSAASRGHGPRDAGHHGAANANAPWSSAAPSHSRSIPADAGAPLEADAQTEKPRRVEAGDAPRFELREGGARGADR